MVAFRSLPDVPIKHPVFHLREPSKIKNIVKYWDKLSIALTMAMLIPFSKIWSNLVTRRPSGVFSLNKIITRRKSCHNTWIITSLTLYLLFGYIFKHHIYSCVHKNKKLEVLWLDWMESNDTYWQNHRNRVAYRPILYPSSWWCEYVSRYICRSILCIRSNQIVKTKSSLSRHISTHT